MRHSIRDYRGILPQKKAKDKPLQEMSRRGLRSQEAINGSLSVQSEKVCADPAEAADESAVFVKTEMEIAGNSDIELGHGAAEYLINDRQIDTFLKIVKCNMRF